MLRFKVNGVRLFNVVALLWGFAHAVRLAMHSARTMGPLRAILRM